MLTELIFHLNDVIRLVTILILSLEYVGESFSNFFISSNPLAHNLDLVEILPSTVFGFKTQETDIVS